MAVESNVYTFEGLRNQSNDELVEFWYELDAPELDELDGEYQGVLIPPLSVTHAAFRKTNGPGEWFAKGFGPRPFGDYPAQGYNLWFDGKRLVRVTRFAVEMGNSLLDGRRSYLGYYAAFNNHNTNYGMTNDIRKVEDGLYLGVIHTKTLTHYYGTVNADTGRSAPHAFLLRGPLYPWQGVDDPELELHENADATTELAPAP